MTQYNTLNVSLPNSWPKKSKSEIKNGTKVTLNLLSNVIGDSNDETNFPHSLVFTDAQASRFRKPLQMVHQLMQNYGKLNYVKWSS